MRVIRNRGVVGWVPRGVRRNVDRLHGDRVEVPGGMVLEHSSDTVPPGPLSIAGVTVPESCAEHDVFLARRGG
ncbi:hypothetical protein [Aeromicrobium sp. HA]|uniref:hypothetical protein n=1 Tax=Aeromicrobium sp. HA TaxID=3009077 RepID=UPI0022AE6864|nr:hypothetical protein [Aeromicrobium sp. HA]